MITQTIFFSTTPQKFYHAFLDAKLHSQITGAAAYIDSKVGGLFSVWGAYATGSILELIPNQKIVMKWRTDEWPVDHYSTVTLLLSEEGNQTKLEFSQINIPEGKETEIAQGWHDYYWDLFKEYFDTKFSMSGN